ncbi:pRL2-19 [Kitasatospora aburaviensis]|uniref:PRL2-19 n=1 Tax=Kitasatospora aburaviensis TaxID=67265 RepID=A0ABW1F693_9ACTN
MTSQPMPSNQDTSHGLLVALLMHLGGSADLPLSAFESDAMGGLQGEFHAVKIDPLDSTTIRLSVVPREPGV